MKQLFNHINGRALGLSFSDSSTDRNIYLWVRGEVINNDGESLENELNFGEVWSCKVSFDAETRIIEIRGDEDLHFIEIKDLELIKLN